MSEDGRKPLDLAANVLSSLASNDSIQIFLACGKGIDSSTKAMKELGITQKRYYTRLRKLIDAGLVWKKRGRYVQTMLGTVCLELVETLFEAVKERNQLKLADKLVESELFSQNEAKKLVSVSDKDLANLIRPVKIFTKHDELIEEIVNYIEDAKKSIYIASYYPDFRVIEALIEARKKKDLKMTFISGRGEQDKTELIGLILSPRLMKALTGFFMSNEEGKVNMRLTELPYCFCVIDGEFSVFELPNPVDKEFDVAFALHDKDISNRLIDHFNTLFEKGEELEVFQRLRKYVPRIS